MKNFFRFPKKTESAANPANPVVENPFVFVISWGRPIYLWSCLDSLYRLTKTPCRIVLIDNYSG
ncbi:MAG: hypothetical protein KDN19_22220, partial [Verrucomicrobiae bacterium]|nr:hypothetical protein [Verrucomicrobiae bacterium]